MSPIIFCDTCILKFINEVYVSSFLSLQPERWQDNGYVKKLQRKQDECYYYFNKSRECPDKDVNKCKLYVYWSGMDIVFAHCLPAVMRQIPKLLKKRPSLWFLNWSHSRIWFQFYFCMLPPSYHGMPDSVYGLQTCRWSAWVYSSYE